MIEFNEPIDFIGPARERVLDCRVPFTVGSCWLEDKKSENSSSSSSNLVLVVFCVEGGGCNVGVKVVTGGDNTPIGGWGVVGLEADGGGGGMRKGTAPEEDVDDVDDIRTTGNDGV